jgi:hypothetical protein
MCNKNSVERRTGAYREVGTEEHLISLRFRFNTYPSKGATILSEFTSRFLFKVEKVQGKQNHFRVQYANYLQTEV